MNPKVSVLLLTYNQDQYIDQSLQSALAQRTNFKFEIIVGDDCSTDSTFERIKHYENIENVTIIKNTKNLGLNKNLVNIFRKCRGNYIAMLEGDDYWHSDKKLQIQADTLDNNPDCSLSCHDIDIVDSTGQIVKKNQHNNDTNILYTLEEVLDFNMIKNCSVMYRNGLVKDFPNWFMQAISCDWPLHVFHAEKGKLAYIQKSLATKRVHSSSLYAAKGREYDLKHQEDFFNKMHQYLPKHYLNQINRKKLDVDYSLFAFYQEKNNKKKMIEYFKKIVFRPISKLQLEYLMKSSLRTLKVLNVWRSLITKSSKKQ